MQSTIEVRTYCYLYALDEKLKDYPKLLFRFPKYLLLVELKTIFSLPSKSRSSVSDRQK
jgi:hypothetical protein